MRLLLRDALPNPNVVLADPFPAPDADDALEVIGGDPPASPVVLSVPHAGREYPPALLAALRLPPAALIRLEDRYIDAVARAARRAEAMVISRRGRAWIDLNRGEDERDPAIDAGAAAGAAVQRSARLRSGLGLVPRRAGSAGDLWRRRFTAAEINARIAEDHRPYHAALAASLERASRRFGVAVLVDLHSMPPLGPGDARIVLGDRFGRSADARFVARAEAAFADEGWRIAINAPYAGGHIVTRHGRPSASVHAVQVEIDRSLYLDARLAEPGAGLPRVAAAVARLCEALADEALAEGARADGAIAAVATDRMAAE